MNYCWTSLIIVLSVGLFLTSTAWYIKGALELDSKSSIVGMGMLYIMILLIIKTLPMMATRVGANREIIPPHCYVNPGMDWIGLGVMFFALFMIKIIIRDSSTIYLGKNFELDSTIMLMMLAYLVLFIISPPLEDGRRGPIMPWFQKRMNSVKKEFSSTILNE